MMYDFIIVGQGLAGTLLDYQLTRAGKQVLIIDNDHKHASSSIAAGLINPITGRKYRKSWMIDQLLPIAKKMYEELSKELSVPLVNERNIIRAFYDPKSENDWFSSSLKPENESYIESNSSIGEYKDSLIPFLGFGELTHSLQIDVPTLIKEYQKKLSKDQRIKIENFDFNELVIEEDSIKYKTDRAHQIIFATGYKVVEQHLFPTYPFQPAKGQAIIFKSSKSKNFQKILRHKEFIVPIGDGLCWSGGGYEWKPKDELPTEEFHQTWLNSMKGILNEEPEIVVQSGGVRPSTKDRRPYIGTHEQFNHVHIFNGMGTKGTSLGPYWSKQFVDCILNKTPLPKEVNYRRFIKES